MLFFLWTKLFFAACVLALAPVAGAAIVISDIQLTASSLSFNLQGTVDRVGANSIDTFFIGDPGNTEWVLQSDLAGTWTNHGGTNQPTGAKTNKFANLSDYVYTTGSAISVGQTVDASFSLQGQPTDLFFDPTKVDVSDWIISAGFTNPMLPDPSVATGYAEAPHAPEPGSLSLLGLAGLVLMRRGKRVATAG